ncbi:MAG TPA: hypothetical protein VGK50_05880 [Coriobacteriia bacterium]|jgi:hypothetical protein
MRSGRDTWTVVAFTSAVVFVTTAGMLYQVPVIAAPFAAGGLACLVIVGLRTRAAQKGEKLLPHVVDGKALLDHYVYVQGEWKRPFYDAYVEWSDKVAQTLKMEERRGFEAKNWRENPATPAYASAHTDELRAALKDQIRYLERAAGREGE